MKIFFYYLLLLFFLLLYHHIYHISSYLYFMYIFFIYLKICLGVIEFLTSGRVAADHRDFKDLAYKSCLQKISGCDKPNEFTHSFKLASAYSEDIMPYTNYT